MQKILFVCLGNICRSPMAEAILKNKIIKQQLPLTVASAGTSGYHNGENAHPKTIATLKKYHIDSSNLISSQLQPDDYLHYDYIVAMDQQNLNDIITLFKQHNPNFQQHSTCIIQKLLPQNIPDPWYSNNFEETYQLCQLGVELLINEILNC